MVPRPDRSNAAVTSLYLDEVDVSILNGALHRAVGDDSGRLPDLLAYLEGELASVVAADTARARRASPSFQTAATDWWSLEAHQLAGDLTEYTDAWRAATAAWAAAQRGPNGAEVVALSALTYRPTAWWTQPPEPSRPPFPFERALHGAERRPFAHGPHPREGGTEAPRERPRGSVAIGSETALHVVYKRNRLIFSAKRPSGAVTVAVDRHHHTLARQFIGPTVIGSLLQRWTTLVNPVRTARYTDAPVYAARHLMHSDDFAWIPEAVSQLRADIDELFEPEPNDARFHARRILQASGPTIAAHIGHAYDVPFELFQDPFETVTTTVPEEHVGVIVLAARLGLLDRVDVERFDAPAFGRDLHMALRISPDADGNTKRDACLATLDGFDAAIERYGAAEYHADMLLHGYLRSKAPDAPFASLLAFIARSRSLAWPGRAALHRFLGISVDKDLETLSGSRGGVRLSDVSANTWQRVDELLSMLDRSDEFWSEGALHDPSIERRDRTEFRLDAAFVAKVLDIASAPVDRSSALRLARWMHDDAAR